MVARCLSLEINNCTKLGLLTRHMVHIPPCYKVWTSSVWHFYLGKYYCALVLYNCAHTFLPRNCDYMCTFVCNNKCEINTTFFILLTAEITETSHSPPIFVTSNSPCILFVPALYITLERFTTPPSPCFTSALENFGFDHQYLYTNY